MSQEGCETLHDEIKNMTKRKIQIIVGLMCLALIGLIGFQWYWIREAIAIRNDQFNHKVAESVQEVVHRLEKQEMMYLLQQRIETEQQKSKLERITQLRNTPMKRTKQVAKEAVRETSQHIPSKIEVVIGPNGEEIHYQIASEGVATDVLSPNFRVMVDRQQKIIEEFFQAQQFGLAGMDEFMRRRMEEEKNLGKAIKDIESKQNKLAQNDRQEVTGSPQYFKANRESTSANDRQNALKDAKYLPLGTKAPDKAEILKEVMKDLLYTQRPIQERVNRFLLDTMEFLCLTNLPYRARIRMG
jgi:two-component system phosphate regulon sensor histidine kinase PhoR